MRSNPQSKRRNGNRNNKQRKTNRRTKRKEGEKMLNLNNKDYWNFVYDKEGTNTWRVYPKTNQKILEEIKQNKLILELGCGMGVLAKQLIQNKNEYIGIDISDRPKQTIHRAGGLFIQENILEFEKTSYKIFDYVIATEFLEHFEDPNQILKITKQFLAPSGTALFAVPNNVLGNDECKEHHQKFTPNTITELFYKHFKHVEIKEYLDFIPNTKLALPTILVKAHNRNEVANYEF